GSMRGPCAARGGRWNARACPPLPNDHPAAPRSGTAAGRSDDRTRTLTMQTFETPDPIFVVFELGVGDVRITASDRTDTVVDVRPTNPARKADVTAAQQTTVDYGNGRLRVLSPNGWRQRQP